MWTWLFGTRSQEKIDIWNQCMEKISAAVDHDQRPMDSDIVELVVAFNVLGIETLESCSGHTDRERNPWVSFRDTSVWDYAKQFRGEDISEEERRKIAYKIGTLVSPTRRRIIDLLDEFYRGRVVSAHVRLVLTKTDQLESWLFAQGSALLFDLSHTERVKAIKSFQKEFQDLGKFLRKKHFSS